MADLVFRAPTGPVPYGFLAQLEFIARDVDDLALSLAGHETELDDYVSRFGTGPSVDRMPEGMDLFSVQVFVASP
jgi:hypothetical protein